MMRFVDLVNALDARRSGNDEQFTASCPAHDDRHPSLSLTVRGGRVLLHCHAGCAFKDIVRALEQRGLWPVQIDQAEAPARDNDAGPPPDLLDFDAELRCPAKSIVERYLRQRGIEVSELQDIARHPKAFHAPSHTWWPAMVAAVRDAHGHVCTLHRTFLSYCRPPTKAPIEPVRMLWRGAAARGCAVHLSPVARKMVIAEGIETTAAAMRILGLPGWSAMSAGNLRHIELPELVREVVIAADNDYPGIAAATAAAQRFRREGRQARVVRPTGYNDFNDVLLGRPG